MSDDAASMILTALKRLEGRFDSLEAKVDGLRTDVMARLDRHEDLLASMRDDITVSMGRAAHTLTVAENTREEARNAGQESAALYRMVKRLESRVEVLEQKQP